MEVIHGAYRSLAAMYHPDLHPGDEEAARIMRVINNSYVALCDPVRKRNHDRWIAEGDFPEIVRPIDPEPTLEQPVIRPAATTQHRRDWLVWFGGVVIAVILIAALFSSGQPTPAPTATGQTPEPLGGEVAAPIPQVVALYARPSLTPNGDPWPTASGYVAGYPLLNTDGQSSLTVDNRERDSDVLVKLYDLGVPQPMPVRVIFLKAKEQLKMETIDAGQYDLRYQDLDSGSRFRSDIFQLKERHEKIEQADRTLYKSETSNAVITLYVTIDGTMHFKEIGPDEF